jgi:hypothetical protein
MRLRIPYLLILLVLIVPNVYGDNCGGGLPCKCGDTVMDNHVLTADITGCTGNGLTIGTSDITLDCNGHTISGSGTNDGISTAGAFDNVNISNCIINNFDEGIYAFGDDNIIITNTTIKNMKNYGVRLQVSLNNQLNNITIYNISGFGYGVLFDRTNKSIIKSSYIFNNTRGITFDDSSHDIVINSKVENNSQYAIWSNGYNINNTIENNTIYKINNLGLYITNGLNYTIKNNHFEESFGEGAVIRLAKTNNSIISENKAYNLYWNFIDIESYYIEIYNNYGYNIGHNYLDMHTDETIIEGGYNNFYNNTGLYIGENAVYITNTIWNIINNNTFSYIDNSGLVAEGNNTSTHNTTFNNNIINYANQYCMFSGAPDNIFNNTICNGNKNISVGSWYRDKSQIGGSIFDGLDVPVNFIVVPWGNTTTRINVNNNGVTYKMGGGETWSLSERDGCTLPETTTYTSSKNFCKGQYYNITSTIGSNDIWLNARNALFINNGAIDCVNRASFYQRVNISGYNCTGYNYGVRTAGGNNYLRIFNNEFRVNVVGIDLPSSKDQRIYNNTIYVPPTTNLNRAGIRLFNGDSNTNNTQIYNNWINGSSSGVRVIGVHGNVSIYENSIHNVGVEGWGGSGIQSTDDSIFIHIFNNTIKNSRWNAIAINSNHSIVEDNILLNSAHHGVDISTAGLGGYYRNNISIINNYMTFRTDVNNNCVYVMNTTNVLIKNNTCMATTLNGITSGRGYYNNYQIIGNYIDTVGDCIETGAKAQTEHSLVNISGNTFKNCPVDVYYFNGEVISQDNNFLDGVANYRQASTGENITVSESSSIGHKFNLSNGAVIQWWGNNGKLLTIKNNVYSLVPLGGTSQYNNLFNKSQDTPIGTNQVAYVGKLNNNDRLFLFEYRTLDQPKPLQIATNTRDVYYNLRGSQVDYRKDGGNTVFNLSSFESSDGYIHILPSTFLKENPYTISSNNLITFASTTYNDNNVRCHATIVKFKDAFILIAGFLGIIFIGLIFDKLIYKEDTKSINLIPVTLEFSSLLTVSVVAIILLIILFKLVFVC